MNASSYTLADRAAGAILGQAVGDFIGVVCERSQPDECAAWLDRVLAADDLGALPGPENWSHEIVNGESVRKDLIETFRLGQVSDDTQCSRRLLQSLHDAAGWDPDDYVQRLVQAWIDRRYVGTGGTTRLALDSIRNGKPWREAGGDAPTNGAAMRAWPLALINGDADALVAAVVESALPTHRSPRAQGAAIAISFAARHVFAGGRPDRLLDAVDAAFAVTDEIDHGIVAAVRGAIGRSLAEAAEAIGAMTPFRDDKWRWISPDGPSTVAWALWSFVTAEGVFMDALSNALCAGGDTDTTAGLAGMLAGAHDPASVPERYRALINDFGAWTADDLGTLARGAERRLSGVA